jgi:hypothetical protein
LAVIKQALSVLPTRPIVYVVPLIVIAVLSFYYADVYSRCTAAREFRASLNETLRSGDTGSPFRLQDVTGFAWDRVRIVTGFRPERKGNACPFGWNWAEGERESLIDSGLLTALIFVHRGAIVEFLELRADEVAIEGADSSLSPRDAVFSVGPYASGGVTLTLIKAPGG